MSKYDQVQGLFKKLYLDTPLLHHDSGRDVTPTQEKTYVLAQRGASRSTHRDIDVRFSIYAQNGAESTGRRRNLTSFSLCCGLFKNPLADTRWRGGGPLAT